MAIQLENPKAYRLPNYAVPRRYDVELDARVGRPEFSGKVTIQLEIEPGHDAIEMHAAELLVLKQATLRAGGRTLAGRIEQSAEAEMARITFDEPVPGGAVTLEIVYDGHVSPTMEGLYHAKTGPEECLCTQCEETDARKIFPCWDEPEFKAQFAWKITTDPQNTVLANGPCTGVEESADGKSKTWTFAPTKPMSSYLVALVIGEIESTPEEVVNGVPLRVWAMKGKGHMGAFAQEYTKRLLPFFEDYFEAPYHFDKYDQVAVPGFAAGAMENAGLVLFVQEALIMNPQNASWVAEKRIAHVVAHEFAHMWFGDLVTMKWWDDLWLNEAFAEWMSHKALDTLNPDYKIWNDFQGGKLSAMASDALESTHPIYSPVETAAQATELFDVITYQKGCSVMRMLENFLGEEAFRAGLRTYMNEFAESNAAGADLWRHLQEASEQPVDQIMGSWIRQGGYPLVRVGLGRGEEGYTVSLVQSRFYSSPSAKRVEQLWHVPVVLRYEDEVGTHEKRVLLSDERLTVSLEAQGDVKWVYANAGEIGFYRQMLEGAALQGVLANLDSLTPLERAGLLGDQWALVRNGTQNIAPFLDVLSAMMGTHDYSLLEMVVGRLHGISTLLEEAGDEEAKAKFGAWVGRSFRAQLDSLGFEPRAGESQNDAQRRVSLIDAMATLAEDPATIQEVNRWADREAADPASVDANLAGLFVGAAARAGDRARFDRNVQVYRERVARSASPQETLRYLYSLPEFRDPALVQAILGLMKDGTIPQEGIGRVLRIMFSTLHGSEAAWGFMKENWTTIRNLGDMWTGTLVEATGNLPSTYRDDIVRFFDANLQGVAEKPYARALETMDQMAEFKSRTRAGLLEWFKSK